MDGGLSAGGGGVSALWPKPSWQTGVPGIPADAHRDVPDISLNSSPDHDGYLYCTQVQTVTSGNNYVSSCQATSFRISDVGQSDNNNLTSAGGTSFAAPAFAGLLAIIEQKLASGGGLGNINPSPLPISRERNYLCFGFSRHHHRKQSGALHYRFDQLPQRFQPSDWLCGRYWL